MTTEEQHIDADEAFSLESLVIQGEQLDKENPLLNPPLSEEAQAQANIEAEAEPEIESAALVSQVIQVSADIFAPNWKIQAEESAQLGQVYGKLLDKYLPDSGLDKYGLELSALMVTAMVIGSRAGVPLKEKPEKKPDTQSNVIEPSEVKADD
ncbi:hypothetical protein [Thalassotalea eurytherma]|uniref:Uncharacterized protein n=1 Tax=Thalassotalea eurytherma TaxID=1144278 RepID=A0ABQ6GZY3_9GAMM|nr:hypothetical protein [Thalassotalea eurytherma]GLX80884.1 hypothetical protein theurythT_03360 [Thalassotalea eurytherma]